MESDWIARQDWQGMVVLESVGHDIVYVTGLGFQCQEYRCSVTADISVSTAACACCGAGSSYSFFHHLGYTR